MTTANELIAKNSAWHLGAKGLGIIIGIITIAIMTRYLGTAGFGNYATALAWLQFFGILVDFGLYLVLLSELGKTDDPSEQQKITGNIMSLRIISGGSLLLISIALGWLMPYDTLTKLVITFLAGSFLCQLINQILTAIFQKHLAMARGAWVEIISKLLTMILLLIAVWQNWGILSVAALITLANIIGTVIIWQFSKKLIRIKLYFDINYQKKIIILAWPLALATIFNLFYFKTDTIILSIFHPASTVGLYAAPYRILEVLISLPPIFLGLLLPQLTKYYQTNKELFWQQIKLGLDVFHAFLIPLLVGGIILARPLITLLAGKEFSEADYLLQILLLATACIFYTQLFTYIIVAIGKQKNILPIAVTASLLALALYFVFIPSGGAGAAALTTLVIEGLVMISYLYLTKKYTLLKLPFINFYKIFLISLLMGSITFIIRDWPVMINIILSTLVYLFGLKYSKVFSFSKIRAMVKT